ncbi:MAG: BrnT family toxin [Oscillospiraceae bacterium]|nr:BrnT family toxin [Oscillospiraceae bacterium]
MQGDIFTWNENKNKSNFNKHGVTFEEARTVFKDENIIYLADEKHSHDEERFVAIGASENSRLLIVCHCYRESGTVIRLISARKAGKGEINFYKGGIP